MNPYIALVVCLALAGAGFAGYSHGTSTTANKYERLRESDRADSERKVREAEDAAHEYERKQRKEMESAAEAAIAQKQADVNRLTKDNGALVRRLKEVSNDASVDAWNRTDIPRALAEPVERVYPPSDEAGSGGGGAISLPPDPSGTAGSM